MSNKFFSYLIFSIIIVLVCSLYIHTLGLNKSLKKYSHVALKLRTKQKLTSCRIIPLTDNNLGKGVQVTWVREFTDIERDEKDFEIDQLNRRLALRVMTLLQPLPDFVFLRGMNRDLVVSSAEITTKPLYLQDYFDFNEKNE